MDDELERLSTIELLPFSLLHKAVGASIDIPEQTYLSASSVVSHGIS